MRVTLAQAADYFRSDFDEIARVVESGCVALDEQGTVNLMLAQALARYVSDEFVEFFGTDQAFVARDIGFVEAEYFNHADRLLPAELGLLDASALGLAPGGRRYVQAAGLRDLINAGILGLSDQTSRVGVLVREPDCSEKQALADAYMLGGARVQGAVRTYIRENAASAA
ncbi:hypothetical protein NUW87_09965 [Corynebacterium pilbarense]|uniref:Uncharacterized protein n=1 Tax=Corynebacterium pilbarense TaxID=1288393 RepID=A0A9Q4NSQ4_9CORY|nr:MULTISPECIES: hypothetical protein [Corynebacterium]MCG7290100.1 hypothetical protein [Corynebacterium sp. ACRPZ]MCG7294716.1 hypothetical protein [Corynebacterium sp. ACRPY]MCZ2221695.1 hypothetical protein [Corynebacterium pilbarense]